MDQDQAVTRHPIHLMLMPFPIALWIFSLAGDCMYAFALGGPVWKDIALYSMVAGVAGGLAAAIPAYFDYRAITDPQLARVASRHMLLNSLIVLLYSMDVAVRLKTGPDAMVPVAASVAGVGLLMASAWWINYFTSVEHTTLDAESWKRAA
jgi:uncharacterized membrane protein